MRTPVSLLALLIAAAVGCAPRSDAPADSAAAASTSGADEAAVRQTVESATATFTDALQRGDTAMLGTLYADDAILMAPGAPLAQGKEAVKQTFAGMLSTMAVSNVKLTPGQVMVSGDIAVEDGTYEMTMTPKGGKAINDKGKYLVVYKRQADGTWKVFRDVFNTDLPPPG
jgi:uncharacterized protein (TIGR02246 family)